MDLRGWVFKLIFKYRNKFRIFFFNYLIHFICFLKGVSLGKKVIFNGIPIIRREPNSKIVFGNNCEFNSSKNSVKVELFKPCTFVTLTKNAEIIFGNNSGSSGSTFVSAKSIKIGNNVMIGANCTFIDNDFHHADPSKRDLGALGEYPARPVVIEDNVFLGFNCIILKGVTIGANSAIGANSVVISNIPPNCIAIGNPCKVVIKKSWSN